MNRIAFVLALGLSVGCKIANEQSCQLPENRDKPECTDTPGPACNENTDCSGDTPICDVPAETCVQCLDSTDCTASATAPICSADNRCEGCQSDEQCPSSVCLGTGACAAPDQVIFAAPTGIDTAGCGQTSDDPCNLQRAIDETTSTRNLVKLLAGTYTAGGSEGFLVDGGNVPHPITLLASGATLTRASNGPALTVKNGGAATLVKGVVTGLTGATGHGTQCLDGDLAVVGTRIEDNSALGVRADNCALTVTNATLRLNRGGGISVNNGTFVVVGNFIHINGSQATTTVGGIVINTGGNPINRLDFNTFNQNVVQAGVATGIQCVAGTFTARNNIVFNNFAATNMVPVGGGCKLAFSDVGPMAIAAANDGGDNVNMVPEFVDEVSDLHLKPTSPLRELADPSSALSGVAAVDLDGDARTSPPDIGADELP